MSAGVRTGLLAGRVAVVTGGGQGIGAAIAQRFVAEGARVVIADLQEAAAVADDLDGAAVAVRCDVTRSDDISRAVELARTEFGRIDVMVNNAGITRDATMAKMTEEQFDQVVAVHLKGVWLGTREAASAMRAQGDGGAIVNMSSISAKVGFFGQTNYSAAKAGVVGLTKAAAKEVGRYRIRVNAIQPGLIDTEMTRAMPDEIFQARIAEIALGRAGDPAEIAGAALFLASDLSSYLTGTVLEVTGGRHM